MYVIEEWQQCGRYLISKAVPMATPARVNNWALSDEAGPGFIR
jgi:hypothetical protein